MASEKTQDLSLLKRANNKNKQRNRNSKRVVVLGLWAVVMLTTALPSHKAQGLWHFVLPAGEKLRFTKLTRELRERTSLEVQDEVRFFSWQQLQAPGGWTHPWLFTTSAALIQDQKQHLRSELIPWLRAGGTVVFAGKSSLISLDYMMSQNAEQISSWQKISPDHELMRSFYLLKDLPTCQAGSWQQWRMDQRMALLQAPVGFLKSLSDEADPALCPQESQETLVRTMVNIIMAILTTDYKKDQIHLPEILKRIR